jgi:hypothetical protein
MAWPTKNGNVGQREPGLWAALAAVGDDDNLAAEPVDSLPRGRQGWGLAVVAHVFAFGRAGLCSSCTPPIKQHTPRVHRRVCRVESHLTDPEADRVTPMMAHAANDRRPWAKKTSRILTCFRVGTRYLR